MAEQKSLERRDFLKIAGGAGVILTAMKAAPSAFASKPKGSSPHRWAMVIDQNKCEGCGRAHNDIHPEISWNRVAACDTVDGEMVYLARPCMQCEHAPCVDVCPVKASYYRPDGIVIPLWCPTIKTGIMPATLR